MRRDERGQASVLLVGVLLIGLAVVGLVLDGARLFTARRDLQNVADSAALAGASAVDEAAYRSSGGGRVVLDVAAARAAVAEVLAASSLPDGVDVDVQVGTDRVGVALGRAVDLQVLGLVGLGPERIGAHAGAEPRTG